MSRLGDEQQGRPTTAAGFRRASRNSFLERTASLSLLSIVAWLVSFALYCPLVFLERKLGLMRENVANGANLSAWAQFVVEF